jgi:DNA polymerase III alpha subunit (gram-positive type)
MADFVFAFLDCEFGGLDPVLHDITEIGVILTDARLAESCEREWKVIARAERVSPASIEISGYDAEVWAREAVPVRQALTQLAAMFPPGVKVVPAGQNVRMDVLFLERAYKNCGIPFPFDYHVIDLATLFFAWSLVAGEKVEALSLRQAATRAGLTQNKVAHRALADARLTLETFRHYVSRLAPREPREEALALAEPPLR